MVVDLFAFDMCIKIVHFNFNKMSNGRFELIVLFCRVRAKVGSVDVDHCLMVLFINDVMEIVYKRYILHHEQFIIKAIVPWLREKGVLEINVLKSLDKDINIIKLEIEFLP